MHLQIEATVMDGYYVDITSCTPRASETIK
jgi:hypothetical protein